MSHYSIITCHIIPLSHVTLFHYHSHIIPLSHVTLFHYHSHIIPLSQSHYSIITVTLFHYHSHIIPLSQSHYSIITCHIIPLSHVTLFHYHMSHYSIITCHIIPLSHVTLFHYHMSHYSIITVIQDCITRLFNQSPLSIYVDQMISIDIPIQGAWISLFTIRSRIKEQWFMSTNFPIIC